MMNAFQQTGQGSGLPNISVYITLKFVKIMSMTLTSKDGKQTEHDGVEEAEAHGQGILMYDSGDDEYGEHGSCSEFLVRQLQGSEEKTERVWITVQGSQGSEGDLCH